MKRHKISNRIMKWVLWYMSIVVIAVMLYFAGWLFLWHYNGQPDIMELRSFIDDVVSAPWVAMIGVVAQYFVDRNHDDIPDILEDKKKQEDEKQDE